MFSDLVFPDHGAKREIVDPVSNETIRRLNLQRVLSLVHYRGGHRRADIAQATGLTRSTVGMLVSELGQRGLIVERSQNERLRGRPSPEVVADGERNCAIAVSVDAAGVAVALVGLGGIIHRALEEPCPSDPSGVLSCEAVTRLASVLIDDAGRNNPIVGIGVAVPGQVRVSDGVVRHAPHLGWREVPLAAMLTERLGLAVTVGNDAAVILGASLVFGSGMGEDLVYLVGRPSGIGGAIISRGRLVQGASGYAGEWGHMPVVRPGERCSCGGTGCLETVVSFERLMAASGLIEGTSEALGAVLAGRDRPKLEREAQRQFDHLEIAVRTIVNSLNPRTVLVGGFLASLLDSRTAAERREFLSRAIAPSVELVDVRCSYGDSESVLLGAAELAFAPLLQAPDLMQHV